MLNNIFSNIPQALPDELFETLLKTPGVRIERIVSKGHSTPVQEWYDQDWDEWVLLLTGSATVDIENSTPVSLIAGDYLLIPAHTRHRVSRTDECCESIWLAIHLH